MPRDGFGREIDYLRIGLTDRCNLRCTYCMPLGEPAPPAGDDLGADELALLGRAAVRAGFRKIRLTGGEPTLRSDLLEVVERLAAVPGLEDLGLTTNGMRLERLAEPLARAGLRRVNVHLDALAPGRLARVMRFGDVDAIWRGIEAAERAGLTPVKLNCVMVRGENEAEAPALARLTLVRSWHVRFIELMPLGTGACADVARRGFVPTAETRAYIEASLGPLARVGPDVAEECRTYRFDGAAGIVGFISPVSAPYCGTCRRLRVTSDGRLRLCLLRDDELDLAPALRAGDEEAVRALLLHAVQAKPAGHGLAAGVGAGDRRMHAIGG